MKQTIKQGEMKIIHSTNERNVFHILSEGIKPASEIGQSIYGLNMSVVSLSVYLANQAFGRQSLAWGDYTFIINPDYVRKHKKQFKIHADNNTEQEFYDFVKELGIEEYKEDVHCEEAHHQIISLEKIPTKAIEALVIQDRKLQSGLELTLPTFNINLYFDNKKRSVRNFEELERIK